MADGDRSIAEHRLHRGVDPAVVSTSVVQAVEAISPVRSIASHRNRCAPALDERSHTKGISRTSSSDDTARKTASDLRPIDSSTRRWIDVVDERRHHQPGSGALVGDPPRADRDEPGDGEEKEHADQRVPRRSQTHAVPPTQPGGNAERQADLDRVLRDPLDQGLGRALRHRPLEQAEGPRNVHAKASIVTSIQAKITITSQTGTSPLQLGLELEGRRGSVHGCSSSVARSASST